MNDAVDMQAVIREIMAFRPLDKARAKAALNLLVSGHATDAQIGAFLVGMNMKGPTVDEITGFYESLMDHAAPFAWQAGSGPLMDVVGTGGDGSGSINISTTAALVVAGCGVPVAKHGNRSASSQSGSADLLAALGADLGYTLDDAVACLDAVGFVFLFAPHCHPAMRHVGRPRQELGIRSMFNIIGPLSNPAPTTHILMGVFSDELLEPLARMLARVGKRGAFVVHGADAMDEFSLAGPNQVAHLAQGAVRRLTIDPLELGFARAGLDAIRGGAPAANAAYTRGILRGEITGPMRDVVVLNAAAALAAEDGDIARHVPEATRSIDDGAALDVLNRFVAQSQEFAA